MAYIMMVGRICGDSFDWDIAMPPLEESELAPQIVPSENMLISRHMNREGYLDMQMNYYLDGYYAAIEGKPLAAMPTEYHENGWWNAMRTNGERDSGEGSIENDHGWIRGGC